MNAAPMPEVAGVHHRWVRAPGATIHVAEAGPADGPTFVLLHGWPQHWWIWRDVIGPLADHGWRVLAMDLRGCGWSEAPARDYRKATMARDASAVLDTLGVAEAHVAGHDWGGWVAQLLAVAEPDRVRALTVLDIASLWTDASVFARHLHRFAYQPVIAMPGLGPAIERSRLLWAQMARNGLPADAVGPYRDAMRDPAHARAGSRFYRDFLGREARASATRDRAGARIEAPVSALLGMDDPVIRPPMVTSLAGHAASFELEEVPGCGHFIVDEAPDVVLRHLLAFHERHR
ncbi:MAG: alpha/beta hydrolase [Acidimicrobiales bacterium]